MTASIDSTHRSLKGTGQTALSTVAMLYCIVLSVAVLLTLPTLVGATVDQLGFSEKQAGRFAAADMFGASLSALATSAIISRVRWRRLLAGAIGALTIANGLSAMTASFEWLLLWRVVGGLGEGVLLSIGNAGIGETRNPDRLYSLATAAQLASGAVALYCLPWLFRAYGLQGAFCTLAGLAAFGMLLIRYMPDEARVRSDPNFANYRFSVPSLVGLAGVLTYFTAQGGVWSYLDRIGADKHISITSVTQALSISSLAGLLGALSAAWLELKLGRRKPVLISALLTVVSLVVLNGTSSFGSFAATVCLFNFAWNCSVPYQFAGLARVDLSRRTVALAGVAAFGGLTAGPIIAAAVIDGNTFANVAWMGIFLSGLSVVFFAILFRRTEVPFPPPEMNASASAAPPRAGQ